MATLQELLTNRSEETHVLGSSDRQPVERVVVDHLGDGVEGLAELAEDDLVGLRISLNSHVHEASWRSWNRKEMSIL